MRIKVRFAAILFVLSLPLMSQTRAADEKVSPSAKPDKSSPAGSHAEWNRQASKADRMRLQEFLGRSPLHFIENQGQTDGQAAFYVEGADKTIFFRPDGITFMIAKRDGRPSSPYLFGMEGRREERESPSAREAAERWIVKMDFQGERDSVIPRGLERRRAVFSYFRGKSEKWRTGVPSYSKIVYEDLWPGIDLVYSGEASRRKCDFLVKPGADPQSIRFQLTGASDVVLRESGVLKIETPIGGFEDDHPTAFQEVEGSRVDVPVKYSLVRSEKGDRFLLGFEAGRFDPRFELVIDPAILACGNCAEPPSGVSLLWNPARAQGEIAGLNAFERKAAIAPQPAVIHLKVRGEPLFVCSRPGHAPAKALKISSGQGGALLSLVVDGDGALAAATMVGDTSGAHLLERAIRDGAPLPPELAASDDPSLIMDHLRRAAKGKRERGGWVCRMCGFTGEGDDPPGICPVCGVGKDQFQAA